jgi:hypothetical protein
MYPEAEQIVLVQGNPNTRGPHRLYAAFEPNEARRLMERIEWHYTPEHGSRLNIAQGAGGNRVVGSGDAAFGGTYGKPSVRGGAGYGVGSGAQRCFLSRGRALHHRGGSRQVEAIVPNRTTAMKQ